METQRLTYILNFICNEIQASNYHDNGICAVIYYLRLNKFISVSEASQVVEFLYANKPTNKNEYSEFMDNEFWCDKLCWWKTISNAPETKQIRIDYLKKLISKIK